MVTLLTSRCLGKIGAVDPGRLMQAETELIGIGSEKLDEILDENFGLDLLKVLLKSVLGTTEAVEYESCSYTIQEVLKIYKVR